MNEATFEWDPAKAESNLAKHGIPFESATTVFFDPIHLDFDVSQPGQGEERRKAVGLMQGRRLRLVTVVYTARGQAIRMISARRANASESRRYEKRSHS